MRMNALQASITLKAVRLLFPTIAYCLLHNVLPSQAYPANPSQSYPHRPGSLPPATNVLASNPNRKPSDYYQSLLSNYKAAAYPRPLPEAPWPENHISGVGGSVSRGLELPISNDYLVDDKVYQDVPDYYDYRFDPNARNIDDGLNYQEKWFDGPVYPDNAAVTSEELTEAALSNLMMNYFLNELEKVGGNGATDGKVKPSKRRNAGTANSFASESKDASIKSLSSMSTGAPTAAPSISTPLPVRSQPRIESPIDVLRRGQKEYPLLRPASESNLRETRAMGTQTDRAWPSKLEESQISPEEQSLMSLKMGSKDRTISRNTRDVLAAELDNLRNEDKQKQRH